MVCNGDLERNVKMTIYKSLGKKIKKFRLLQGLSQEQLAEACFLSASYISCIERGTKKINLEKLERLACQLNFIIDIYPRTIKELDRLDSEIVSFLSICNTNEKDFFKKAIKVIIKGIEANYLD